MAPAGEQAKWVVNDAPLARAEVEADTAATGAEGTSLTPPPSMDVVISPTANVSSSAPAAPVAQPLSPRVESQVSVEGNLLWDFGEVMLMATDAHEATDLLVFVAVHSPRDPCQIRRKRLGSLVLT